MPGRRISRIALQVLAWPAQAVARLRPEGLLFLILALGCGFCSIGSNPWSNVPLLMCLVLVSLWLLAMWQGTRSLRGLRLRRSHIERTFANEHLSVVLYVSNTSRWPSAGLVITEQIESDDTAAATDPQAPPRTPAARSPTAFGGAFVTVVPGKGQERVRYTIMPRRRGLYRFGETAIETVFPLGFFHTAAASRNWRCRWSSCAGRGRRARRRTSAGCVNTGRATTRSGSIGAAARG
ncbi:MAG: hypothetical protein NTW87_34140 [Planctomycetota bacterium]|nr:hypothetical protein [Planctomycetota bacterium]